MSCSLAAVVAELQHSAAVSECVIKCCMQDLVSVGPGRDG